MFGAVAAGKARGGFDSIFEAAKVVPRLNDYVYEPILITLQSTIDYTTSTKAFTTILAASEPGDKVLKRSRKAFRARGVRSQDTGQERDKRRG